MDVQLVFTPPKKTDKGFARRLMRASEFQEAFSSNKITPQVIDGLVDFLSDYCSVEGMDRAQMKNVIFDLSQEEFETMIGQIAGGKDDAPPLAN